MILFKNNFILFFLLFSFFINIKLLIYAFLITTTSAFQQLQSPFFIFPIIFNSYPTMKQQQTFEWQRGKYYRCRPALYQSVVVGSYLLDIDGTQLFVYELEDLAFKTSIEVLSKEDIFCAKLRAFNDKFVGVFGMYKFWIISLENFQIVQGSGSTLPTMIEYVEAKNNYLAILTSDEQGQDKLLYFWKFTADGKIQKQFPAFDVHLPEFEECSEDRLQMAIFESIDFNPKVYLFWRTTSNLLELDPSKRLEQRYNRSKNTNYLTDIDNNHYCEISESKIKICSKKDGKQVGSFMNAKEEFKKIIIKTGECKEYFSISNQGVKRWKLENNAQPLLYAESEKYPVQNLYFNSRGELVGINVEKKFIMIWKSDKEVIIHNFPTEVIKKMMKVNDTQVCLLLEATISKEIQNQIQVEKHNKMEIYDFVKDRAIAKKAVLKLQYKIDIESAIVGYDGSIIFILNQITQDSVKKYIFKWSPFNEDKKKQSRKRQITDSNNYNSIKLYPFERIITFKKSKDSEMYDPFGKASQSKSQISIFDFSAKKIGDYEIAGDIKQIELSHNNQIYALGKDKFSIYQINSSYKNRLQKIHELQVAVSFVYPFDNFIIMKKEASIIVYDQQFDFIMKDDENQDIQNYKILKVSDKKFILASDQEVSVWDLQSQSKKVLQIKECEPNLIELVGDRNLLIADKWIKSFDFYELQK